MSRCLSPMSTTFFPAVDQAECSDNRGEYERCETDSKNCGVKAMESHAFEATSAI